jgi:hypothetical protein
MNPIKRIQVKCRVTPLRSLTGGTYVPRSQRTRPVLVMEQAAFTETECGRPNHIAQAA